MGAPNTQGLSLLGRRLAVLVLLLGVVTLHHLAAHHGAADTDHLTAHGQSAAGHDAEPAAGIDDLATPMSAQDVAVRPATDGDPRPQHPDLAVLAASLLGALAVVAFLVRGSPVAPGGICPWSRGCSSGRGPPPRPPSAPTRLALLQAYLV